MKFSVNTAALAGLPALLDRRRDELLAGADYVATHTTISHWDQGFLNQLRGTHEAIVKAVEQFLHTAATQRADPYALAVSRADAYYTRTDLDAAARFDATLTASAGRDGYPGLPQPAADQGLGPAIFADATAAPGYPAVHDYRVDYEVIQHWWDWLSPTTYARDVVWRVTSVLTDLGLLDRPIDVMQEYFEQFAGDWAAFRTCADVWDAVAIQLDYESGAVRHGGDRTQLIWTGGAADACRLAVDVFGDDLHAAAGTLRAAAANYREVAEQMKQITEAIIAVVTFIVDFCADKALEALVPGSEILEFLDDTTDVARFLNKVWEARGLVLAAASAVTGFLTGTGDGLTLAMLGKLGPLTLTGVGGLRLPGATADEGSRWLVAR
jgi:hypothetical protein